LATKWNTAAYTEPDEFAEALTREVPFWEADAWTQQEVVGSWRAGQSTLPDAVVRYWARSTERYAFTRVALVDHLLGDCTGIEVLQGVHGWRGHAVLLTGVSDLQVAVRAFNDRLIARYESKGSGPLFPRLADVVGELQEMPDQRLDQIWRSTLLPEQDAVLRRPDIARELASYLRRRVAEYVVIGEPFGIFGLTARGELAWMPLRLAVTGGLEWVSDGEMREALSLRSGSPEEMPGVRFGASGQLIGGFFLIREYAAVQSIGGYGSWLALQRPVNQQGYVQRG
jgi:hypothetical protein